MSDTMNPQEVRDSSPYFNNAETRLTEREMQIAKLAASMAVKDIMDGFYQDVGRTLIQRVLIIAGAFVVGLAAGKGWLGALIK
jgi:hypothetical protein